MIRNCNVIGEKLFFSRTDYGMPVYIIKKNSIRTFYMALSVNFGSMDLNYVNLQLKRQIILPRGMAHFLEHSIFESKGYDLFNRFTRQGAFINAYTNLTSTIYYLSCIENIEENIKLFLNTLQNMFICKKKIEEEKNIILQEINMYSNDPSSRVYANLMNTMYERNYVKYDIAGSKKDMELINESILYRCYNDFYVPDNMTILAMGNINENRVFDIINNLWYKKGSKNKIKLIYPNEPDTVVKPVITERDENLSQSIFAIGLKHKNKKVNLLEYEQSLNILMEYLFGSLSSFYENLYNSNKIDSSFTFNINVHSKYAFTIFSGGSSDPGYVHKRLLYEIEKVKNSEVNENYIDLIKNMLIGNYLKGFDNPTFLINSFLSYKNKGCNFLEIHDVINDVKIGKVIKEFVKDFNSNIINMSIIVP